MSTASVALVVIARTLPAPIRARYLEEWQADREGAHELGLPQWQVIRGALATSVLVDRDSPAVTGMPVQVLWVRRARWASALLLSAFTVMAVGLWFGNFERVSAASILALLLCAASLGCAGFALRAGVVVFGARKALLFAVLVGLPGVLSLALALVPLIGIVYGGVALWVVLFLAAGGPRHQSPPRPLPRRARVALSSAFSVITMAMAAVAVLHTLVWNPLAKVPELSLADIYAAMERAGQYSGGGVVIGWGVVFVVLALAFPVFCTMGRFDGPRSTRRIVVVGSLLVASVTFTYWFVSFGMGIAIADTFATSGADANIPTTGVLMYSGLLFALLAIAAGLLPTKWRGPEQAAPDIALAH